MKRNNDEDYRKMIQSRHWAELRRYKLTQNPLCERCMEEGRTRAASEIHHVKPVEDAMTPTEMRRLMFDVHNLRSLCHDCHVKTHTEMGRSGAKHNKRVQAKRLEQFKERFLDEDNESK